MVVILLSVFYCWRLVLRTVVKTRIDYVVDYYRAIRHDYYMLPRLVMLQWFHIDQFP